MLAKQVIETSDEELRKISDGIASVDEWIASQIRPKDITRSERSIEQGFEEMCLLIQKNTSAKVKEMTVIEFYTMLSLIKKKKI
jgi:hypothetical protein